MKSVKQPIQKPVGGIRVPGAPPLMIPHVPGMHKDQFDNDGHGRPNKPVRQHAANSLDVRQPLDK